jgi:hypothetical protein
MWTEAMSTSDLVSVVGFVRIVVGLAAIGLLGWWFNRRRARPGGPR